MPPRLGHRYFAKYHPTKPCHSIRKLNQLVVEAQNKICRLTNVKQGQVSSAKRSRVWRNPWRFCGTYLSEKSVGYPGWFSHLVLAVMAVCIISARIIRRFGQRTPYSLFTGHYHLAPGVAPLISTARSLIYHRLFDSNVLVQLISILFNSRLGVLATVIMSIFWA